ncbi:MAG TPA: ABC transporter ATP-binding protein [Xanthobacteraceae bacterium]|jgi:NitT/TauT family transport system ATP-binding protein|nr:NitT/TauT family transport system ATP-binding protein [Alphaproteobacteria bacterium]
MAASEITAAAEGFVRISGLGKVFRREEGSVQVLRNVSITVPNRQFISILGASGCGKTTLLMMLAGLESITSGTIEIARQSVTKPRRDVGIIFQDPTLLPWKTALENVLFPIEIFGLPLAEYRPRAQALLELVALGEAMHMRPRQLSGGMRQRVAICRALIHTPAVLLMDEPFSALDAITRDELNLMLIDVWERYHQTAFFVTHSIREAVFLSDRVVVLGGAPGHVVADVTIPFERPRAPTLGETLAFNRICGELRTAIAESTATSRRDHTAAMRAQA